MTWFTFRVVPPVNGRGHRVATWPPEVGEVGRQMSDPPGTGRTASCASGGDRSQLSVQNSNVIALSSVI